MIRSIIKDEEMQYYKFELMVKLPPMQNKIKNVFVTSLPDNWLICCLGRVHRTTVQIGVRSMVSQAPPGENYMIIAQLSLGGA